MRYFNLIKNISNWHQYLAFKFGIKKDDPLHFMTRKGIHLEVPRRLVQTFKEIFMDECYIQGLGRPVPPSPIVMDIGANAGYFSFFALSRFPDARVFAFEPLPANFRLLERQMTLNSSENLTCFPRAVAGEAGTVTLSYDARDSFSTSATVFKDTPGQPDSVDVEAVTLHDVFTEYKIERCDLLKMDCEGAEYDILYRCLPEDLRRIDQIAMEVHRGPKGNENIDALEAFFRSNGFLTRRRPVGMLWAWRGES